MPDLFVVEPANRPRGVLFPEARSAAAAEGQWVQKKVPLAVVPPTNHSEEGSLRDLITLCRVLFEEEQHAFSKAIEAASDE